MTRRDDAWVRLADVPADCDAFLDAVGREPLRLDVGHTTFALTRDGDAFAAECYGSGGGWYASRRLSRRQLRQYVAAADAVRLKRPEHQRPEGSA